VHQLDNADHVGSDWLFDYEERDTCNGGFDKWTHPWRTLGRMIGKKGVLSIKFKLIHQPPHSSESYGYLQLRVLYQFARGLPPNDRVDCRLLQRSPEGTTIASTRSSSCNPATTSSKSRCPCTSKTRSRSKRGVLTITQNGPRWVSSQWSSTPAMDSEWKNNSFMHDAPPMPHLLWPTIAIPNQRSRSVASHVIMFPFEVGAVPSKGRNCMGHNT
jgi:hypothetical protein